MMRLCNTVKYSIFFVLAYDLLVLKLENTQKAEAHRQSEVIARAGHTNNVVSRSELSPFMHKNCS
jgi:hypothetical protein